MIGNEVNGWWYRLLLVAMLGNGGVFVSAQGIHQVAPLENSTRESVTPHLTEHESRTQTLSTKETRSDQSLAFESPTTGRPSDGNPLEGFPSLPGQSPLESSAGKSVASSGVRPLVTTTASLLVVLGVFAAFVWGSRKFAPKSSGGGALPESAIRMLGSKQLDPRNRVLMLRCGDRVLVVSESSQGMQTLSEIVDPDEVEHLTQTCLGQSIPVNRRAGEKPGDVSPHGSRQRIPVRYA